MKHQYLLLLVPSVGLALTAACGSDNTATVDGGASSTSSSTSSSSSSSSGDGGSTSSSSSSSSSSSGDGGSTSSSSSSGDAAVPTFAVGGNVTGLSGKGLVLQNNGADDVTITAGTFTFATKIATGKPYAVTIKTQPSDPTQTCTVTNGNGTMGSAAITNVTVTCATNSYDVGGALAGLPAGTNVVLQNNGADDLALNANATFKFAAKVASGAGYDVTVKTQPTGGFCGVATGKGTVTNAAITNVAVTCTAATSCKAIKAVSPSAPDGKYQLAPVGGGANYEAYCDMTTNGGGWTLALKAGGASTVFNYDAAYWTDDVTLMEASTDLSATEAKFASFSNVAFTEVRAVFDTGGVVKPIVVAQAGTSLRDLFNGGYVPTAIGRNTWMGLVPGAGLQMNCNQEGFNNAIGGYAKARLGIFGNQENECNSPDSFIGFGTAGGLCSGGSAVVGNKSSCDPIFDIDGAQIGATLIQSFGYLFVR